MTDGQIAGLVIMIFGGVQAVRPDILLNFQIWTQRVIMGAEYRPSARTYKIVRTIGALLIVFGLAGLVGFLG